MEIRQCVNAGLVPRPSPYTVFLIKIRYEDNSILSFIEFLFNLPSACIFYSILYAKYSSVSPSIPESGWATRFDFGLIE